MHAFLIRPYLAIMFATICAKDVKNLEGGKPMFNYVIQREKRSLNENLKIESGLDKSLKGNREVEQSETKSSFKFPYEKIVERVTRDSEKVIGGAPFYPGSPGDQKTEPEVVPDCKNCVWSAQPGRVGEGARLRLDFSHPSSNCSCPNFRGSAEVLAGPWRLPPETPVIIGRESSPQTTLRDVETMTRVTQKPAGFLKGIQDFFKHSFHMDKTTTSLQSTTTPAPEKSSSEVAKSNAFQSQPSSVFLNRPHEDVGKSDKAFSSFSSSSSSLPEIKQQSKGREATFNLRIKAVALPRRNGSKMVLRSLKRKSQRAERKSGNERTGDDEETP